MCDGHAHTHTCTQTSDRHITTTAYNPLAKYRVVKVGKFAPPFALLKNKMLSFSMGFAPDHLTRDSALDLAGGYTSKLPLQACALCSPGAPDFYEEIYTDERSVRKSTNGREKGKKSNGRKGKGMEKKLR